MNFEQLTIYKPSLTADTRLTVNCRKIGYFLGIDHLQERIHRLSLFVVEAHDPGLRSLMSRCSRATVSCSDTLEGPWKWATIEELMIFVGPWLSVAIFFRLIVALNRRGYSWLSVAIFFAVAIFAAAGIFAVFPWLFF